MPSVNAKVASLLESRTYTPICPGAEKLAVLGTTSKTGGLVAFSASIIAILGYLVYSYIEGGGVR